MRARHSSPRRRRLAGMLIGLVLGIASGGCGDGEVGPETSGDARRPNAFRPSESGSRYDRAVARMAHANHLLEQRQADLFFASEEAAPVEVVADLRREVAALERSYAAAIVAMAETARCEASYCPEGVGR